ncbi:MAG: zinc transporter ZupT [Akkermansiaceae bacterium]|nr:zinc transporter ZupT [Akkermansiaceae bacterium]
MLQETLGHPLVLGGVLSLFAGLCTGVGAAVALFVRRSDTRLLTFALGASAGVMVYISFMELMPGAARLLAGCEGSKWVLMAAFFGGMALACLIDHLIPEDENPHEIHDVAELDRVQSTGQFAGRESVRRGALLFAIAIGVHNFPEGMATVAAAFDNADTAFSVALAVAVHNIPEGIAVAVPLLYGTGDRGKAFRLATLTGLAEPLGALLCMLVLMPLMSHVVLAALFAVVSGIMVYISFDELLPMAERWGHHHLSIYGVTAGMLLMALTL